MITKAEKYTFSRRNFKQAKQVAKQIRLSKMANKDRSSVNKRKTFIICTTAFLLILLGILLIFLTGSSRSQEKLDTYLESGVFAKGITVEDTNISGLTMAQAADTLANITRTKLENTMISYEIKDTHYQIDAFSMGLATNIESILVEAMLYEKAGTLAERLTNNRILKEDGIAYMLKITADESAVLVKVTDLVSIYNVTPTEPQMTFNPDAETEDGYFVWSEAISGTEVDENAFCKLIINQISLGDYNLGKIPYNIITSNQTAKAVTSDVVKLSEFSTSYANGTLNEENRVYNISFMAEKLNGSVIEPNETWSINEMTGERTKSAGWKSAPTIYNGILIDEMGGGVCQVSTTIYNAFLLAEVGVVERHAHSYPSSYVNTGLDATIDYGNKDLVVMNTLDDTIYVIVVSDEQEKTLTAMVYGPKSDHDYQVVVRALILEDDIKPEGDKVYKVADGGYAPDGAFVNIGSVYAYPKTQNGSRWKTYRYYYPMDYDIEEDSPYSWIGYEIGDNSSGEKAEVMFTRENSEEKSIVTYYPPQPGVYYLNPDDQRIGELIG